MPKADYWENVYRNKKFDAVSWYAPHLGDSLRSIEQLCPDKTAAIVDIGAGAEPARDLVVFITDRHRASPAALRRRRALSLMPGTTRPTARSTSLVP